MRSSQAYEIVQPLKKFVTEFSTTQSLDEIVASVRSFLDEITPKLIASQLFKVVSISSCIDGTTTYSTVYTSCIPFTRTEIIEVIVNLSEFHQHSGYVKEHLPNVDCMSDPHTPHRERTPT